MANRFSIKLTHYPFSNAEQSAKAAGTGVWADESPIPPWEWRDGKRPQPETIAESDRETFDKPALPPAVISTASDDEQTEPAIIELPRSQSSPAQSPQIRQPSQSLTHWLNTSSNVRHNSTCRHFNNTKSGRRCSSSEGKPCGICGG